MSSRRLFTEASSTASPDLSLQIGPPSIAPSAISDAGSGSRAFIDLSLSSTMSWFHRLPCGVGSWEASQNLMRSRFLPRYPTKRSTRAPRMRWTSSLHTRFVRAVELLGGHESMRILPDLAPLHYYLSCAV
ncbi:hypothetical protein BHE74_00036078 [Ensete ventricosum]|nr:hypothetical protein BHE74_00036078 [Ensete ventricosum]RZS17402.1 hypothetical protein BHM03_00049547 [Ensete ventricosum]